jgi:hypothetical protein
MLPTCACRRRNYTIDCCHWVAYPAALLLKQLFVPCCTGADAGDVQGGRITSLCLTDTQLLLGSSAGAVRSTFTSVTPSHTRLRCAAMV